jgi:hypothetical protein
MAVMAPKSLAPFAQKVSDALLGDVDVWRPRRPGPAADRVASGHAELVGGPHDEALDAHAAVRRGALPRRRGHVEVEVLGVVACSPRFGFVRPCRRYSPLLQLIETANNR